MNIEVSIKIKIKDVVQELSLEEARGIVTALSFLLQAQQINIPSIWTQPVPQTGIGSSPYTPFPNQILMANGDH